MKVRLQTNDILESPIVVKNLETVMIVDDYDQPLAVFQATAKGGIWSKDIRDADFYKTIAELGYAGRQAKLSTLEAVPHQEQPQE